MPAWRAERKRRVVTGTQAKACATIILLACCRCAYALSPSLDINQYAHNAWTVRDGFFKTASHAIAQTPDGYLWLGTESGLLRFDGIRAVPWEAPSGADLPDSYIRSLLATRDGRLWIGTAKGLASWKDGKLTQYPELAEQGIVSLLEDREGTVWAGGAGNPSGRLCAVQGGNAQCYGEDGRFGDTVTRLYEDSRGNLWAGSGTGLWRWKPGPAKRYPVPETPLGLTEGDDNRLLIAMPGGIRQLVDGKAEPFPLPGASRQFKTMRMLRDRDGGLWIGTNGQGLLHTHQGRTDLVTQSDGLAGDAIFDLFEDREGNIWVATSDGLDRFRDFAVPTISVKQGLSNGFVGSVLAAMDGSVWLATRDGLDRWKDGRITIYRGRRSGLPDDAVESLFQDDRGRIWVSTNGGIVYFENGQFTAISAVPGRFVSSFAGDGAGSLWISHELQGLFRLDEGSVIEQIPWARLACKGYASALSLDVIQGGLWLGFRNGCMAFFKEGQVRASYAVADGLGKGRVSGFQLDRGGTVSVATEGGLSRVKDGHIATLTSKNGLPCDAAHWAMEDDSHSFWLYMACGLVRFTRSELDAWVADSRRTIQLTVFDSSDGVRSGPLGTGYTPNVARSADGKMWFLPGDGVSVIDPPHLPLNRLPPPVHVEEVKVDGKDWDASHGWRLPALTRDLEIHYTALSLVAPEKNRFKYKLEGRDSDWKDAGNERKASYTDLPPRNYRFRVMASNNSGVWNETGASFDFSVDPKYYQTGWFQASCVAAFLALLAGLYRLRVKQVEQRLSIRMEERVNERTRIARDLHDTLLQSFQGVLLKFYAATYKLSDDSARTELEGVIEQARSAIAEGRDAVQGLRSSATVTNDLALAMGKVGQELAAHGNGTHFELQVVGEPRELVPIVRDEAYRIGCEALRNAFRHSRAKRIEAEIQYEPRRLQLRVRDNGKGIDPKVLKEGGSAGHHGLPGMHERAKLAGGKLAVWSELDSGAEIELTIPGSVAYPKKAPDKEPG